MDAELSNLSVGYFEELFEAYCRDPDRVDPTWRGYFDRITEGNGHLKVDRLRPSFRPPTLFNPTPGGNGAFVGEDLRVARLQERVDQLIRNYRVRGHNRAQIDPLGMPRPEQPELDPAFYGFTESDLDRPFSTSTIRGSNIQTLRDIIRRLDDTYCNRIGAQFMHIDELDVRGWLQRRMENSENRLKLSRSQQLQILTKLTDAVIFEEFVRRKYVGAKTFSLEGAESLIPLLDLAIEKLVSQGIREIVMGMSHRGRLNVLANIVGKSFHDIFREFEDVDAQLYDNRGDVKYHLGYHNYIRTSSGKEVHISLGFNPSHLEFVNPVTLGRLRAKQDRFGDSRQEVAVGLLIHGDAAFSGEGIVQETLNLSQLPGYATGGTIHVIVNNQIGFTTTPAEGRSCNYASDVAKMLQIPIFHVNGEDPEAVAQVVDLALDFRRNFRRDVVIDMYCFRRLGHNEGDEPSFTQPRMYQAIAARDSVRESYFKRLKELGEVSQAEADEIIERRQQILEEELSLARRDDFVHQAGTLESMWEGYLGHEECFVEDVDTGVKRSKLVQWLTQLTTLPEGFHVHRKLKRFLGNRREMAEGNKPLDWASAEVLAFASATAEGYRVRLSGQDCQRGTFSQRHLVLHDVENDACYMPLAHLSDDQAAVEIYNSPLSEAGVLGFEYGYSLAFPDGLVIWEAQFGDFVNAAQVIIDQFIASGEDKWRHLSGLIMLLPHGFEGQGPEHSSARMERFLSLAADDNLQIVVPSTPAQYFHVLRRQVVRRWRKPLVVFTPKSLLRNPQTVSPLEDLTRGRFQRVIPDAEVGNGNVERILLCSGKVYYDLLAARAERHRDDVAIVRVEQLYPLSESQLASALKPYRDGTPVVWVQEEPENMGAWRHLLLTFGDELFGRFPLDCVTRPASASPATGSAATHRLEQAEIIDKAFGDN
jgi:2-oxoglutarate dehydrogenase E1 component